jgi:hypothetical protein
VCVDSRGSTGEVGSSRTTMRQQRQVQLQLFYLIMIMRATPKTYRSEEGSLSKYLLKEEFLSRSKDPPLGLSLSYLGSVLININPTLTPSG